ncbi:hypothetical protein JHW43_002366 [Diplocarpon mali]|nr:hypothetical protein JHW43_002366 [Diplocarpon mali]
MERLTSPPSSSRPYSLPAFGGELWTIPTSNSVMRLLVTGKETSNAFAVVSTGGTNDKPIGFHFHREAHDVFLCLKGTMNVWADDKARTLREGDFASVPPNKRQARIHDWEQRADRSSPKNTVHQYQITSPHTEFAGLIIPGGWEEFFRFVGEPYSGPLFPTNDKRNPFEVLIPKLMAATETFDMVPVRDKAHFEPQPWDPATDSKLPGTYARGGYFLQADTGSRFVVGGTSPLLFPQSPRHLLLPLLPSLPPQQTRHHSIENRAQSPAANQHSPPTGTVVRPLATRRETASRFSIHDLLSSSLHAASPAASPPRLSFATTHHAILVVSGSLEIELTLPPSAPAAAASGSTTASTAAAGETVFVPAGTPFKIAAATRFARAYVFANGGGLGEVLCRVGREYEAPGVPDESVGWDEGGLKGLEGELGFVVAV